MWGKGFSPHIQISNKIRVPIHAMFLSRGWETATLIGSLEGTRFSPNVKCSRINVGLGPPGLIPQTPRDGSEFQVLL
jgi:hypothetical protein